MQATNSKSHAMDRMVTALRILVLAGALAIVVDLSYSILQNGYYDPENGITLHLQLAVCVVFLLDYLVRFIYAGDKWHYFKRNIVLLIFSIPYLNIIHHFDLGLSQHAHYMLSLVPLLRAAFALAMIIHWFARRRSTSLLVSYLVIMAAVVYFGTLLFYVMEKGVNTLVINYYDALWWGLMDLTTVGSNIVAVTPIGKVLSVVLSAMGMLVLPVFTVYITDKIQVLNQKQQPPRQDDERVDGQ